MVLGSIVYHGSLLETKGSILKQGLNSCLQNLVRMFRTSILPISPIVQERDEPEREPGRGGGQQWGVWHSLKVAFTSLTLLYSGSHEQFQDLLFWPERVCYNVIGLGIQKEC